MLQIYISCVAKNERFSSEKCKNFLGRAWTPPNNEKRTPLLKLLPSINVVGIGSTFQHPSPTSRIWIRRLSSSVTLAWWNRHALYIRNRLRVRVLAVGVGHISRMPVHRAYDCSVLWVQYGLIQKLCEKSYMSGSSILSQR